MRITYFICIFLIFIVFPFLSRSQGLYGRWRCIQHTIHSTGKADRNILDELYQVKPCARNTIYEFRTNGQAFMYIRDCDISYTRMQLKIWRKARFEVKDDRFILYLNNFSKPVEYVIKFESRIIVLTNSEETIVYERA
ncbi:MAG: hypothetical protein HWD58_09330 [Bacteroidota bacterium]|nr:MAG: hypothetical protein HWD58_09330 [Bacteroidota bacterium]